MPQVTECLNNTIREVELYSDEWIIAKENESRELGMMIRKALYTHDYILRTDEFYLSSMGMSRCRYDAVIDIKILSLMIAWRDISKAIHDQADNLQFYGFDVDHSVRFDRKLENASWILSPSLTDDAKSDWELLLKMGADGFRFKRYDNKDDEWWASAPTALPLKSLREKNMRSAGIVGDEFAEFTDLQKYPGTLLSELREFLLIREGKSNVEAVV